MWPEGLAEAQFDASCVISYSIRSNASSTPSLLASLHPWIVRGVGVHGRAAVIDGFGSQFVVPGFVAVDLA